MLHIAFLLTYAGVYSAIW